MENIFEILLPNAGNGSELVIDVTDGTEKRHTEI